VQRKQKQLLSSKHPFPDCHFDIVAEGNAEVQVVVRVLSTQPVEIYEKNDRNVSNRCSKLAGPGSRPFFVVF
jgi:hypothetical protein